MNVVHGLKTPQAYRGGFLSIGNFDGVHRGHQAMLATLVRSAASRNVPAVVFTFDPHPISLLRPEHAPPALSTISRRLELIAESGVDYTIVYPTDHHFLSLTPREFFEQIVQGEISAAGLVEGPNFFFGHHRAGTIDTLREYCGEADIGLEIVEPVVVSGRMVSSSEIRRLIMAGDVSAAAELLGSPYVLRGVVCHGSERGRTIGFPTANLSEVATLIPRDGVYAGRAVVAGQSYAAAMNVGPNPTFEEPQPKLEVHLLDFEGDLYGQSLRVEFLQRLRDTVKFESLERLCAQLRSDVDRARSLVKAWPAG
jgi:riboflavin kinase/FMN adenylyltransferase